MSRSENPSAYNGSGDTAAAGNKGFVVVVLVLILGFIGFLIPAIYFTVQTGMFSQLWIGAIIFLVVMLILLIVWYMIHLI
jgi:hypothetical protein